MYDYTGLSGGEPPPENRTPDIPGPSEPVASPLETREAVSPPVPEIVSEMPVSPAPDLPSLPELPDLPDLPELPVPPPSPPVIGAAWDVPGPSNAATWTISMPPPETPSPPPSGAALERRRSGRVLLSCCIALVVSLILGMAAFSILGVHMDRAENGVLRFWIGPAPAVVITAAPAPSPLAVTETPSAAAPPAGEGMRAEDIYSKAAPGVVGVLSEMNRSGATGTGMVIREDGYILTNHHVVDEAHTITVVLPDGTELEARLIGSDYLSDIAVLKVSRTGLSIVELGSSDVMVTGAKCYAIGNPLGMELQNTFTDGMISAINRDIVISDPRYGEISMTVLQTNCAVNPGNSGGPLLNDQGQVIGIVSSKIMGDFTSTVEGLGFAIPVDTAIPIINSLIEHGYVKGRPVIGITASATQLDERTAADLNLPLGVVIDDVTRSSDAYRQGIRKGDIITHVNGEEVATVVEINRIKNRFKAGDTITLTIYSQGTIRDVDVLLGDAAG
jgi:serine protease Do